MLESKPKRKTRSDKFPLTLHKTGQFCKKIKGKLYYFGKYKQKALELYLEQATYLHLGKTNEVKSSGNDISLKTLSNFYLDYQHHQAQSEEITWRHVYDQTALLRSFAKYIGSNRMVSDITTADLQNYYKKLVTSGKAARTINNRITAVKSMFNWAINNEIVEKIPNLKAIKKLTPLKAEKPIFNIHQIKKILEYASPQMKAMILLGLNCGFGCTDCAELQWIHIHFENSRIIFPRGKPGVPRNLCLWLETVAALKAIPNKGEHVFYTMKGNLRVRIIKSTSKDGREKFTSEDTISKDFSKLLKKAGIKTEKGVGFYTLRRTAATLAARSGDPFAVQRLLGHTDLKMASVYVQDVSEQTDKVVNNVRNLIIQGGSSPEANAVTDAGK
jgi:integrase